jgi:flavorubredoxin
MTTKITDEVIYIGVNDKDLDLFESQYIVPNGVSYNSYVIMDEKIAIMDTADQRATKEWFENLKEALGERKPDYLIISHMEPDHAANIKRLIDAYPEIKVVGNARTFPILNQFFELELGDKKVEVKEGETLSLGSHELTFTLAPMVHWPEVMMVYDSKDKILFSADAFGKFGTLDTDEEWLCEARRYYFNIVGKYGTMVQAILKKVSAFNIEKICPLHGPILTENLDFYIGKYNLWSSYVPEDKGIVVACASIHGHTKEAALKLVEKLEAKGEKVSFFDLTRDDSAKAIEDAFRYDRLVLAACTYDGGLFPCMEAFVHHLAAKFYQNRTIGLIENGSWAPQAAKEMKASIDTMKNIKLLEPVVTIKSALNAASEAKLDELVQALVG